MFDADIDDVDNLIILSNRENAAKIYKYIYIKTVLIMSMLNFKNETKIKDVTLIVYIFLYSHEL